MRIRIKYSKTGILKFIGHLDTMRFFQKALRRAGFDVIYSEGFSPHMIMSFALPLGVGVTSEGEYFDLQVRSVTTQEDMIKRLNEQMPEDIEVLNIIRTGDDKSSKCMTLVAAADYEIRFSDAGELGEDWAAGFEEFLDKEEIPVIKKTKKSEKTINIRPLIFGHSFDGDTLSLRLSAGSVDNLKPSLVIEAFCDACGKDPGSVSYHVHRKELLMSKDDSFYPLDRFAREFAV